MVGGYSSSKIVIMFSTVLVLVIQVSISANVAQVSGAVTSTTITGVIVPLYTYPTSTTWDTMIQSKIANPSVPMVAIINPSSGPGSAQDLNYVTGIQELQAANITVLGYTYTSYSSRSASAVQADEDKYKAWYNVNGIFFDEMSNIAGEESYYKNLDTYAKALGFTLTVGNPGTDTLSSYVGTVDNIVIYESSGLPSLSYLDGWHSNYDKRNFSMLPYGVSTLDSSYVASAISYLGYIYITNDALSNPWDSLPPYFADLVATIATANSGQAPDGSPAPSQHTITVQSADLKGKPITGMWTTVKKDGATIQTGYTPLSFAAQDGVTYDVSVSNYKQHVFDHWDDGTKTNQRTITTSQDMTLTAYYKR
jgi:spherulation-specific family 4 protein